MRFAIAALALLASTTAPAAQIHVTTASHVVVQVDCELLHFADLGSRAKAIGLAGGTHEIKVSSLYGKPILSLTLDVEPTEMVHLNYARRSLQITSRDAVGATPAPAAGPPPGPVAMDAASFGKLRSAVSDESFSSDKVDLVKSAASRNHFTIEQVGALIEEAVHSSDKVEIAEILAPKVIDPENAFLLNEHLTHSSDKEEVQKLFR